jgi:hypothetical protein
VWKTRACSALRNAAADKTISVFEFLDVTNRILEIIWAYNGADLRYGQKYKPEQIDWFIRFLADCIPHLVRQAHTAKTSLFLSRRRYGRLKAEAVRSEKSRGVQIFGNFGLAKQNTLDH